MKPQDEISFICGRSGHCIGGLWFQIWSFSMSCFYSGDFQRRSLAFGVDEISGRTADLAIVDCAHPDTLYHADALRRELFETIETALAKQQRVILPLPKYGRGAETNVEQMEAGALVIVTGRVKNTGFVNSLLEQGAAVRCFYPHHQSMGDFLETVGRNSFRMVLPFHNERKEVYFN